MPCRRPIAAALAFFAGSTLAAAAPGVPEARTLKNGLRVVVLEDHALPRVAVSLWVHAGSKDEIAEVAGYAHFLEHMLQRAGGGAPFEYQRRAPRWGGALAVHASYDRTAFTTSGVPAALPEMIDALADMALRATFKDEDVDQELAALHQEIRSYYDEPSSVAFLETMRAAFPAHPYRFPPLGNFRTLGKVKAAPLLAFRSNLYVPGNMAIVVAGDLDPARASALIEKAFGTMAPSLTVAPKAAPPAGFAGHEDIEKRVAVSEAWATLSFAGPGYRHPDRAAFELIARALGDPGGAPVSAAVQRDRLGSDTRVLYYRLEDGGMLYAGISPATPPLAWDAAAAALRAIAEFKKKGLDEPSVRRLADRMLLEERLRAERLQDRVEGLGEAALFGGVRYYWDLPSVWSRLTAEDVRRVATRWLVGENLRLVVLLPEGTAPVPEEKKAAFHEALDNLGGIADAAHADTASSDAAPAAGPVVSGGAARRRPAPAGAAAPPPATASPSATTTPPADAPPVPSPAFERRLYQGDDGDRIDASAWGDPRDARGLRDSQRFELANGLAIVVQEDHRQPLAAVSLTLRAGSGDDPAGKAGTANLASRLLCAVNAPGGAGEFRRLRKPGGTATEATLLPEVQVARDLTEIRFRVAPADLDEALASLGRCLREPAANAAAFDRLRRSAAESLHRAADDPSYVALELFRERVYEGHGYAHAVLGTPASLAAVTLEDVVAFQKSFVRPDRAVLAVAGDVDGAALQKMAKDALGGWKRAGGKGEEEAAAGGAAAPRDASAGARGGEFTRLVASKQSEMIVGVPGVPASHADFETLRLLGTALAIESYEDLVFTRRAAYSAVAVPETFLQGGALALQITAPPTRRDEAVFDVQRLMRALAMEGLPERELKDMTRVQAGRDIARLEGTGALASALAYRISTGLGTAGLRAPAPPPDPARVRDVAARYLKPDAWITVKTGPAAP